MRDSDINLRAVDFGCYEFSKVPVPFLPTQVGLYELMQPDGRERLVTYEADRDSGFNANVSYQNAQGSGYMFR